MYMSSDLLEVRVSDHFMMDIAYESLLRNLSICVTGCSLVMLLTSTPDLWTHCVTQRCTMSTLSFVMLRLEKAHSRSSLHNTVPNPLPSLPAFLLISLHNKYGFQRYVFIITVPKLSQDIYLSRQKWLVCLLRWSLVEHVEFRWELIKGHFSFVLRHCPVTEAKPLDITFWRPQQSWDFTAPCVPQSTSVPSLYAACEHGDLHKSFISSAWKKYSPESFVSH